MKTWKKIILILLLIFIVIQFFHPEPNRSEAAPTNNITNFYSADENIQNILKTSCYDCHSNNTRYPWYSKIEPVAWWLDDHIAEGKRHANYDAFGSYSLARQYHVLEESIDQVKKGEMPLGSYTLIHTESKLTDAQRQAFINWCQSIRDTMKAKYPADSLKMPPRKR
ncbi:MAG: heme-binding domain-containing protein [Ilyomonas sp.]